MDVFPKSLCKPLSNAILNRLLIPSLPSSLGLLPAFQELVERATDLEDKYIVGILGNAAHDREIKVWADGVSGHYERKRRMEILEEARVVIVNTENGGTFMAEIVRWGAEDVKSEVVPVQGRESVQEDGDDAWGLDEEGVREHAEEIGWGFDDEDESEVVPVSMPEQDDDPANAWGWNDEEESLVDDDPWAEEINQPTRPPAAPSLPKSGTRLEEPRANGTSPTKLADKRPPLIAIKEPPKETYLVSERTKNIIRLVEDTLNEGQEFASSRLFLPPPSSPLGTLILQTSLSIFDLYRALYPVTFGAHFALSSELALRFSNDCLYLSGEAGRIESTLPTKSPMKQKLEDSKQNLKILGESWFEESIVSFHRRIGSIIRMVNCDPPLRTINGGR